jgi:hypothetical protein
VANAKDLAPEQGGDAEEAGAKDADEFALDQGSFEMAGLKSKRTRWKKHRFLNSGLFRNILAYIHCIV